MSKRVPIFPLGEVWSIREEVAHEMVGHLNSLPKAALTYDYEADKFKMTYEVQGDVAVIDCSGPLARNPSYWMRWVGGVSTSLLAQTLEEVRNNDQIRSVLLKFNSPGGTVDGADEAAQAITEFGKVKPINAYVEGACCSAAYWLASACGKIYAGPTSFIGSLGTLIVLYDTSKALAKDGIEAVVISTGKFKGMGTPGAPITKEQRAKYQSYADAANQVFMDAVQRNRGLSADETSELFTGELFIGKQAVDAKLIDGIMPYAKVLGKMSSVALGVRPTTGGMRMSENNLLTAIGRKLGLKANEDGTVTEETVSPPENRAGGAPGSTASVHPLVARLEALGITDVAGLAKLEARATLGDQFRNEAIEYGKKQAVRLYGAEKGVTIGAQLDHLDVADIKSATKAWETEADTKFGFGKDGAPAPRVSAANDLPDITTTAVNAEDATNAEGKLSELLAMTNLGQRAANGKGKS